MTIKPPNKLLRRPTDSRPDLLEDLIWVIAATIEDSILESSNAIPNKDYTVMDLYNLAAPFALENFKKNLVCFTDIWPAQID